MIKFSCSKYWTRQTQLITCIGTCAFLYCISTVAALSSIFVLLSVFLGIGIYALQLLIKRIPDQLKYRKGVLILCWVLPVIMLGIIQSYLDQTHKLALMLQVIGFIVLGWLLVSLRRRKYVETSNQ